MMKPLKSEPTPLVSLFIVVTTIMVAIFAYQRFFSTGVFDFTPVMMWVTVAIPAGVLASIFLQVRANERAQRIAQQVHARVEALSVQPQVTGEGRRTTTPTLEKSLPEKDPFESL